MCLRMTVFEIVFVAGFVLGSVVRVAYTRAYRRGTAAETRRTAADTALTGLAGVAMLLPFPAMATDWLDFASLTLPDAVGWVGVAVFAVAIWLLWRSHVDLGRNWAPVPELRDDHTLITTGVYRRVRHPMYTAHWVWAVGQALLIHNWVAGPALLVAFVPFTLVRLPAEERMMLDRFGEAYRAYAARTGRFIPPLRRPPTDGNTRTDS
jgi:protein-S-isoprenylcysteine O-methyltransferase Ste14